MKIMYVCINRSVENIGKVKGRENIFQCIRKYWKMSETDFEKAKEADYVAGVVDGLIYEICKPHNWDLVMNFPDMKDDDEVIKNPNIRYRYAFVAEPASEEIRKQYLGKKFNKSFDKYSVYLFEY